MKKTPFTYASFAALYIVIIILGVTSTPYFVGKNETIFIPMAMLSLFVISAAIMGFLFVSEPILLCFEKKRKEAVSFFLHTVGFFACFAVIFGSIAICTSYL